MVWHSGAAHERHDYQETFSASTSPRLIIGTSGGGSATPAASTPGATTTVTAAPGEKVTVPGPTKTVPGPVRTVTAPPPGPKASITEDGTWLVGSEVKPGTYRSGTNPDCYYARLSSTAGGGVDNIIDNGNGANQTVTIKKSDKAFETRRCDSWTKIG